MRRLRFCMCLTLILLLFLRSETRPLNSNIEGSNQFRSLLALVQDAKEMLNYDSQSEDTTPHRDPAREIPGGPDAKHHYKHQK
ncbi:hypothetical protein CFP56_010116 [Quercus suber]|uniref:Uncharacterized protein n=1 Tax=Quercus suber TaxID=58331 RepID=A0AAW0L143_QUESU